MAVPSRFRIAVGAFALALSSAVATPPASAQSPSHEAAIRVLIDETKAMALGRQMMDQLLAQLLPLVARLNPQAGQAVAEILRNEFQDVLDERMAEFEAFMVRLYAQHFSEAEIGQLIAFYRTPVGRKTIEVMPQLMSEGQRFGVVWGQRLGEEAARRAFDRLRAEGYDVPT